MGPGTTCVSGVTVILPGIIPSKKNSKRRIMRGGKIFMVPSAQHERWHTETMIRLKSYKNSIGPPIEKCRIEIDFFPQSLRRADLSNKAESIMDALVDAGILKDDNWFVCHDLHLKMMRPDKLNPGAIVRIIKT